MKHHWWWWWWHDRHRHDLRGDSVPPILWTSRVVVAVAGSSSRRHHDSNHALLLLVGQWRRWWRWVATVAILVFFLFFVGRNLSYLPYSNNDYSSTGTATATATTNSSSSFQLHQYPSNRRNDDDNDDDEDKAGRRSASLQLIWHVGPMKTGTTTLQSALREWQDILLRDDQWAYLGPSSFMMTSNNNTQNQIGHLKAPDFAERFSRFLADEFQPRHLNVIVSSEYFSIEFRSEQYRAVQRALAKFTNYQVQIVIGYRPYYEWIPSRYSQAYKYTPQQRSSSSHKRRPKNPQQPATTASAMHDAYPWKDSRGHWKHPVPPMFPTYFAQIDQSEQIFTDHVYDYVQPYFTNITIISLAAQSDNNTADWVATWLCDILRAAHTCQQYSKKLLWQQPSPPPQNHSITTTSSTSTSTTSTSSIVNPSRLSSIRADVIGLAAAAQGWIDMVRYARLTVMEATEQYMRHNRTTTETATTTTPNGSNSDNTLRANGNHNRLPLICPDSTLLDRLWEQTVAKETRLFHSSSSSSSSSSGLTVERVTQLRQGFQHFLDDQTYCHVNVTAVLDDPDWRHFLAQFQK